MLIDVHPRHSEPTLGAISTAASRGGLAGCRPGRYEKDDGSSSRCTPTSREAEGFLTRIYVIACFERFLRRERDCLRPLSCPPYTG